MKKNAITHNLDGLAALLLFAVFAASVMAVLLTGAKAYRGVTRRDQEAYNARTAVQYVAQRVRQADSLYGITLEDFEGVECLVLGQGEPYITRLYCYEGWLMELYCLAGESFSPEDGERIIEAQELKLSLDQGMLGVQVLTAQEEAPGSRTSELWLELRSS
ncbi:DUF4860 domain-containing protein [Acutalibacter sp.]|jgi:hypothetical protein|uniref:DUF4860 domain-containing protein n=1 Tax=Acutalibacter sp. TaxID=1918636 RepID=UPI002170E2EA|nr:DUF4860 domain-containing protein [Acutalibacter sp.]